MESKAHLYTGTQKDFPQPDETDTQRPPRPAKKDEATAQEGAPAAETAPAATKEVAATA